MYESSKFGLVILVAYIRLKEQSIKIILFTGSSIWWLSPSNHQSQQNTRHGRTNSFDSLNGTSQYIFQLSTFSSTPPPHPVEGTPLFLPTSKKVWYDTTVTDNDINFLRSKFLDDNNCFTNIYLIFLPILQIICTVWLKRARGLAEAGRESGCESAPKHRAKTSLRNSARNAAMTLFQRWNL